MTWKINVCNRSQNDTCWPLDFKPSYSCNILANVIYVPVLPTPALQCTIIYESSLIRLRPVLMTTFSTMLGAIPLVLGSGAGAESRYAMAVVVLGGISLSSLITLYLVPALYRSIETRKS